MRFTAPVLLLLASFVIARADDVVEVPPPAAGKWAEFKCDPGKQLVLKVAKATEWALVDDAGQLTVLGDTAVFSASEAARYRLVAVAEGKLLKIAVTVGAPGPNPKPPQPPPADVLKAKIKAAVEADAPDPEDVKKLAALYRAAVKTCTAKEVATTAELLRRVREAGTSLVGADSLKTTRTAAKDALRAAMGKSSDEPITEAERKAAADLFGKLAEILEGL